MPRWLREADVRALLTVEDTMAALEAAFREWAAGRAANQPRRRVGSGTVLATMSAALPAKGVMGFKAYTTGPSGARFWICLFGTNDGRPRAVMEADWLGRMRTGAVSGLATRYLAHADASILGVIGAGSQALTQVLAVAAVRRLQQVRVWSRSPQRRTRFVDDLRQALPKAIRPREVADARQAVEGAHIISTITSAEEPVLSGTWIAPGQHLNICGSNVRNRREVDAAAVARADLLVADDIEAARLEAGDFLLAERDGALDWDGVHALKDVVAGAVGRRQPSNVTLFKSVGLAIEDVATAALVLERAEARGLGQLVPD